MFFLITFLVIIMAVSVRQIIAKRRYRRRIAETKRERDTENEAYRQAEQERQAAWDAVVPDIEVLIPLVLERDEAATAEFLANVPGWDRLYQGTYRSRSHPCSYTDALRMAENYVPTLNRLTALLAQLAEAEAAKNTEDALKLTGELLEECSGCGWDKCLGGAVAELEIDVTALKTSFGELVEKKYGQLVMAAPNSGEAFIELRKLIAGSTDNRTIIGRFGTPLAYPYEWNKWVVKYYHNPTRNDFKNVQDFMRGDLLLLGARAFIERDPCNAQIVLAYCNASEKCHAEVGDPLRKDLAVIAEEAWQRQATEVSSSET